MTTILAYRSDGGRPYCELVLESGERILITLDRGGATVERLASGEHAGAVLFRASPDEVARIAVAVSVSVREPLEIVLRLVAPLPSAERIAAAFAAALETSPTLHSRLVRWFIRHW